MLVFIQVGLGPWPLEEIHNPFNTTLHTKRSMRKISVQPRRLLQPNCRRSIAELYKTHTIALCAY